MDYEWEHRARCIEHERNVLVEQVAYIERQHEESLSACEGELGECVDDLAEITAQRDELLEACEAIVALLEMDIDTISTSDFVGLRDVCEAAIANGRPDTKGE